MIKLSQVKFDCRHFKGHIPCRPNKLYGVMCNDCSYYDRTDIKILIIKLGAAGDVIRTTPLLHPLRKEFPNSKIYWLTYSAELIPLSTTPHADEVLKYSLQTVTFIMATKFDLIINLDKDPEAIGIMNKSEAKNKLGYTLKDGHCYPANKESEHKFLTGIFDNYSIENKKSYMEEIFEICGYKYDNERYLIDVHKEFELDHPIDQNKKVIGLNTGCGERWTSRLWKDQYWIQLIGKLQNENFEVILLGGPAENNKNISISNATGAKYFGVFDIRTFVNLVNRCDLVVTQVTMSLHIAIALEKKVVLMNNIFNSNEFYLFGNGEIIQPKKKCMCYFQPECINTEYKCMDFIMPEDIFESCNKLLKTKIP